MYFLRVQHRNKTVRFERTTTAAADGVPTLLSRLPTTEINLKVLDIRKLNGYFSCFLATTLQPRNNCSGFDSLLLGGEGCKQCTNFEMGCPTRECSEPFIELM